MRQLVRQNMAAAMRDPGKDACQSMDKTTKGFVIAYASSFWSDQIKWAEWVDNDHRRYERVDSTTAKTLLATVVGLFLLGSFGYAVRCHPRLQAWRGLPAIPVPDFDECARPY